MTIESLFNSLSNHRRIGKFVSVGATGGIIETIILAILTTTLGTAPLIAKAVGSEFSISIMFVINDMWTFSNNGKTGRIAFVRRWIKSHTVRMFGILVGFLILFLLTNRVQFSLYVSDVDIWPTLANILGIVAGMSFNYVAESIFTWRLT